MIINNSSIQLASARQYSEQLKRKESLQFWVGARPNPDAQAQSSSSQRTASPNSMNMTWSRETTMDAAELSLSSLASAQGSDEGMSAMMATIDRLMAGRDALLSMEQKQRDDLKRDAESDQKKAAQAGDISAEEDDQSLPPDLKLLKLILEKGFGIKLKPLLARYGVAGVTQIAEKILGVKLKLSAKPEGSTPRSALRIDLPVNHSQGQNQNQGQEPAAQATSRPNWGMIYDRQDIYSESEKTSFSAAGIVKTADGKEIQFNVSLNMSREFVQASSFQVRAGAATDPLVINFNGSAAQLAESRFGFDLDLDGTKEQIANTGSNSAFLALDRNGDGRINDGRELFGPTTGDGFAELAKFDSDGNQWIDEKDAVYSRLRVWQPTSNGGGGTVTLQEAGVGAIYLGRQGTQFELTDAQNDSLGQVATSGVYLQENGAVGTIQQVNLVA